VDHTEYMHLIGEIEKLPKVKKVFIRSGIRFDYLMLDKNDAFFRKLVADNVSGQLKVAPEHCSSPVLRCMGKPDFTVYQSFRKKFFEITKSIGKEQYLVPYLMSSHPGSTMQDAVKMALWLKENGYSPEQVQDFYPTPGTVSTVMYATGIHPLTGEKVYVCRDYREKQMQRALLQAGRPENADLVREALRLCHREDLIGNGPECLVRPARGQGAPSAKPAPSPKQGRAFGGKMPERGGRKAAPHGGGGRRETERGHYPKTDKNSRGGGRKKR
jgi:radical SAM superfamily enzyme YgiQ (UPF0313 family)